MTIKQKQFSKSKLIILTAILLVIGAGGIVALRVNSQAAADNDTSKNDKNNMQTKSPFSFNAGVTNGWYVGPSGQKDMAVFGGREIDATGKESTETHFAMIDYRDDGVSKADWLSRLDENDDPRYDRVHDKEISAVLQTDKGPINYELHSHINKLKAGAPDPGPYGLNGAEVSGYIPYENGYFRIQGYATPAEIMPEVIEAINAFSFDSSKQTF